MAAAGMVGIVIAVIVGIAVAVVGMTRIARAIGKRVGSMTVTVMPMLMMIAVVMRGVVRACQRRVGMRVTDIDVMHVSGMRATGMRNGMLLLRGSVRMSVPTARHARGVLHRMQLAGQSQCRPHDDAQHQQHQHAGSERERRGGGGHSHGMGLVWIPVWSLRAMRLSGPVMPALRSPHPMRRWCQPIEA